MWFAQVEKLSDVRMTKTIIVKILANVQTTVLKKRSLNNNE